MRYIAEQLNLLFGYDFTNPDNKAVLKGVVARVLEERDVGEKEKAPEPKKKPAGDREEPRLPPKKARSRHGARASPAMFSRLKAAPRMQAMRRSRALTPS